MLFNVRNAKFVLKGSKFNRQLFLICFIFIGLFSACRKESEEVKPQTKADAIQKAKQWFAHRKALMPILKSGENPLTEADREPDWSNTDLQMHFSAPLLEMPLKYDDKYLTSSFRDPETGILKTGITKLLLRQESDSTFKPVIMRIYGDSAYLAKTGNQFEENSFTQIAPDFSGEVFYYDWQENFLGANHFLDGQLIKVYRPNLNKSACLEVEVSITSCPDLLALGKSSSSDDCITTTYVIVRCSGGSPGGPTPDAGGNPYTPPSGGGGGGTTGGTGYDPFCLICEDEEVQPIPEISAELKKITTDWYTMTEEEWVAVDNLFKKGLENPYIKKMYDKLAANPPFKIALEAFEEEDDINKSERLGSYREEYFFSNNQFSKGIRLNKKLFTDPAYKQFFMVTLFAELTHAYQHSIYQGEYKDLKLSLNIETEQRFFIEFVEYMSRDDKGIGIFNLKKGYSFVGNDNAQNQLLEWLEEIKNSSPNTPNISNVEPKYSSFFMPKFKETWKNTDYGTLPIVPNEILYAVLLLFP